MFRRQILVGDLIRANGSGEPSASRLRDWPIGALRAIEASSRVQRPALPCLIDPTHARTLYAIGLDPKKVREAPFAGLFAKQEAAEVLLVPWEFGAINRPRIQIDPIYVFSSGRCGSTLVIRRTAPGSPAAPPHNAPRS
jgi:hypothetical protein